MSWAALHDCTKHAIAIAIMEKRDLIVMLVVLLDDGVSRIIGIFQTSLA